MSRARQAQPRKVGYELTVKDGDRHGIVRIRATSEASAIIKAARKLGVTTDAVKHVRCLG